jgi:predicted amidophosphoribosyltransferase
MATPPPSFPPSLRFASLAIYPQKPHLTQRQKEAAAFIVSGVKRDAVTRTSPQRSIIELTVERLVQRIPGSRLEGFFDGAWALVPMPGSAAYAKANSVTPTRSICRAMHASGLGERVLPILRRVQTVQKSAFSSPSERPSAVAHFESMAVELPLHEAPPARVLLVDDVVTRGATAMGAAARLRASFPEVTVALFTIARLDPMTEAFYDPCVGVITIQADGSQVRRLNHRDLASPDSVEDTPF